MRNHGLVVNEEVLQPILGSTPRTPDTRWNVNVSEEKKYYKNIID